VTLVATPLDVIGIRVDQIGFAHIVVSIDDEADLDVGALIKRHVEVDPTPAYVEGLAKVIEPLERFP
jgi:hypothetical protein